MPMTSSAGPWHVLNMYIKKNRVNHLHTHAFIHTHTYVHININKYMHACVCVTTFVLCDYGISNRKTLGGGIE